MGDNTAKHDPDATQAFSTRGGDVTREVPLFQERTSSSSGKSGRLEVRCPSCHMPTDVEADTTLTDLTCRSCGSHFSLIDQSQTTQMAPPLSTMGRFELVERLGVGGFGSVWKARDKELDRTVAIKIPRATGMTAEEQEKFFREARAAAQLRHPSIVSVHEVGRDGESVYIVSDFVRGVTLGDWLSGQQLTSREAAEICAKVADALEHAHEQGVVHRDLKPANIMMDYDGEPHLMDFGLARRESGEVTMTVDGQVLGTPAYMSPEQAQGEAHRADRRSDIYSLGVILFQLLTRELPFRGNARMLVKQVIHDEPPSPRKLNSHVAKDLETITLKCLEKEPARRYQTARELCDELKRHLTGEPIHARPISGLERAWRWCKRNSLAAALMLTVAATLTAGVIASSYYAASASREATATKVALHQAEAERKRVERVNTFFMDEVFGLADPTSFDRAGISLVEALDIAASKIDQRFADDPELRVAIQDRLGDIYRTIDEPQKAQAQLEKAVATWKELAGPMDPRALKSRGNLGMVLFNEGRFSEAKALLQSTLADQTKVIGAGHPDAVRTAINLGLVLMDMRDDHDVETAENTYQNALKALGPRSTVTFDAQSSYAWTLRWRGQSEKALPLAKTAAFGLREASGGDDLRTMYAVYNYASCLADVGQFSEAVDELKVLLATRRRVLGPAHVDTIYTAWRYAQFSRRSGDDAAALAVLDDVCANLDAIEATGNLRRAGPLMMFAGVVEGMGQDEKVAQIQAAAYKIYSRALDRGDQVESANFLNALAWAMATSSLDKFRNGKRAVELATKACELSNYHDANIVDTLAAAYAEVGDFDAAVKWSEKSLELLGDKDPAKRESFSAALTKYKAKEPMRIAPISPATRKRVVWSVPNLPDPGSEATTDTTTSTSPPTDKK